MQSRASAEFWLGGQCPIAAWGEENIITSTPTPYSENCSFLYILAFYFFSSIFPGGSAYPICPYVRTPMHAVEIVGVWLLQRDDRRLRLERGNVVLAGHGRRRDRPAV